MDYDGKRSWTYIWMFRRWKSWWRPPAHHHHRLHNTRYNQYYIFFNRRKQICNKHHLGLKTKPKWKLMVMMMINQSLALMPSYNQQTPKFYHPESKLQTKEHWYPKPKVRCSTTWKFRVGKHRVLYDKNFLHFFVNVDFGSRFMMNLFALCIQQVSLPFHSIKGQNLSIFQLLTPLS